VIDWKKLLGYFMNPVVWIAVAVIAAGVVLYRKFFMDSSQIGFDRAGGGGNLSLPDHAYATIAKNLQNAMYGLGTNTEEGGIFELLKGLNKDDLIRVYNEFGLRKNGDTSLKFWNVPKMDLIDWFKDELSGDDLDRMEKVWRVTDLWR
jgi:hypothetical protein